MPIDTEKDNLTTALAKLKAREDSLKQFEALSNLGSWEVDLITKKSIWSDQSYKIYGRDKESSEPSLELFFSHLLPEELPKAQKTLQEIMQSAEPISFETKIRKVDGTIANILIHGKVVFDEKNNPLKLIGTTQDITKQVSLKSHSDELSNLLKHSSNEIYIVDLNTMKYLYVNKGACDSLGYSSDELLQMDIYDINPYLTKEEVSELRNILITTDKLINRTVHRRKDNTTYHVQAYIHTMKYYGVDAYVIFDTNISQTIELELEHDKQSQLLKEQAKKLDYQAHHDTLTKLPNRTLFKDRLSQAIISSNRNSEEFALLFIDLDKFKKINDSLGHHIGDAVLVEAASRLQNSLREEDTLARLGGDEFIVILKDIKHIQGVSIVAKKIVHTMKEPIEVENHSLYISASIGISLYPKDATNEHDLIKFADTAMYKAKEEGRDNYQFYSSHMTTLALEKVTVESNLKTAIKEKQFIVYFQPQFSTYNDKITGMEALVRWIHPELGMTPPAKFIPIAEDSGLIIEIDLIVMKLAMKQFAQWYKDGLNPGILSINLAMRQLSDDNFINNLLQIMNYLEFKPRWLELEVTEGQVMNNPRTSIEKLKQISEIGISLAIDDFGTGYSSLAYLKKLPLNKLKIDQSFIKDIPDDEDDKSITKAIIALGESLNLNLIAEGVETEAQKEFLVKNGCHNIQGYLYAKPMPAKKATELLISKIEQG